MMLNRQSVKRISAAVRSVERAAGGGGGSRADLLATVLRIAKVGLVSVGDPLEGEPYIYAAAIYSGHWDDDKATRPHIYDDGEIWSATELEADAWVAVIRIGGHWEVIGSAGDGGELDPPADPTHYTTLGSNAKGAEAASTDTWTVGDDDAGTPPNLKGLRIWVQTRQAYYHDGDKKWYAYAREKRYDTDGRLYSVSAETRIVIETPQAF